MKQSSEMTAKKTSDSDGNTVDDQRGSEFVVFGDNNVSHAQNFSCLLTQDALLELGEVDRSWFTCKAPSIEFSSVVSEDVHDLAPNVAEIDFPQENSPNHPLSVPLSPILSRRTRCKGCSNIIEHHCLDTPSNVDIDKLLKTPSMYEISPFVQCVGRASNLLHSTPDNVTLSLGATMGGNELSWSSSMATPNLSKSVDKSAKGNSFADDYQCKVNKLAISKKLFNSQLYIPEYKADNSDSEHTLDSIKLINLRHRESSEEYCSRLDCTPLRNLTPSGVSSQKTCVLETANGLFAEAELKSPVTPAPISCCDSEDTPKCSKRGYKSAVRSVKLYASQKEDNVINEENSWTETTVNTSPMCHATTPPPVLIPHEPFDNDTYVGSELSNTLEGDPDLSTRYNEANDNSELIAEQVESCKLSECTSMDNFQKEYMQLENMIVPGPVSTEDSVTCIIQATSLKEYLPNDVELPMGPCAVKVDVSADDMNFNSAIAEKQFEQDDSPVNVESKLLQVVEKDLVNLPDSGQRNDAKFEENYEQGQSSSHTHNDILTQTDTLSPKSNIGKSAEPKVFFESTIQNRNICSLTGSYDVLEDGDDDLFLNITSFDARAKLQSIEKTELNVQLAEMGDGNRHPKLCIPAKLAQMEHPMASNKSVQPEQNALQLSNRDGQAQMEFKGCASAGVKSIMMSEATLEKAKNVFKEDSLSMLMNCEKQLGKQAVGLIEQNTDQKSQTQASCTAVENEIVSGKLLLMTTDLGKGKSTCNEDELPLLPCPEHHPAPSRHKNKTLADCKTEESATSDSSSKTAKLDRTTSNTVVSKIDNPLIFGSKQNEPKSERSVNEAAFYIQNSVALKANAAMNLLPPRTCKGFSTASGKPVVVSEVALKMAKRVFKDDDLSEVEMPELIQFDGFMDEKNSEPSDERHFPMNQRISELVNIPPQLACKGFSTASGKSVVISKAALDKGRSIFLKEDLEECKNLDECPKITQSVLEDGSRSKASIADVPKLIKLTSTNATAGQGFSTASGKAVLISKNGLEKARNMVKEDDLPLLFVSEVKKPVSSTEVGREFENVENASNNNNTVKMLDSRKQAFIKPHRDNLATRSANACFPSFSLASGRQVHISKSALEKAKRIFSEECLDSEQTMTNLDKNASRFMSVENNSFSDDVVEDGPITSNRYEDKSKNTDHAQKVFNGFVTASGKGAPVSAVALQQARVSLSKNTSRAIIGSSQESDSSQPFATVPDLKIGSGDFEIQNASELSVIKDIHHVPFKSVSVSDTCKKRTFDTVDNCEQNVCKRMRCSTPIIEQKTSVTRPVSFGLSLASEKNVFVSKKSLEAARSMFTNNDESESGLQEVPLSPYSSVQESKLQLCPMDDWSSLSEEFSHDMTKEDDTILAEKGCSIHSSPEVSSIGIVDEHHTVQSGFQNEMSAEIMESTDALLADEMTCTPIKGGKRSSSWLSPIKGRPKKLFSHNAIRLCLTSPQISVPEMGANGTGDSSVIVARSNNVNKCYWRSVPSKLVPHEIQQIRLLAVEEQLLSIEKRKRVKVLPVTGVLWQKKLLKESKQSLRSIVNGTLPKRVSSNEAIMHGVKMSTLKIQSYNAGDYQFLWEEHYDGSHLDCAEVTLTSGSRLIFDGENLAGKKEFYRAFLDTAGVDSKLVDETWVFNHYRWIVWKLAAMEVSFPKKFGGRLLTPDEVMLSLHYRYNREIDFSHRSALKKITERDDTPAKTLVLCVVSIDEQIQQQDDSTILDSTSSNDVCATKCIELTDGWYSMKAIIDIPLIRLVKSGQICIGQKLIIHGAELVGSAEACPPLEAPANLALKISANCCRRAKWDAKLGYLACPKPFPLPLISLFPDGGLVGCVHILVARIYPIQYLEKRNDGTSAVYNDRTNNRADLQFENKKSFLMEKIFLDVQSKFDHEENTRAQASRRSFRNNNNSRDEIKGLINGDDIFRVLENSADPSHIESCLSNTQITTLNNYKEALIENQRAKFEAEIQKAVDNESKKCAVDRKVIPFVKFRAIGVLQKDFQKRTGCLITLWKPGPEVCTMLKEGKVFCAYYLMAESRSFSSMRQQELQLKSTKLTKLEEKHESDDIISKTFIPRNLTSLASIGIPGFSPQFGEIDIIGLIVHIGYQEQGKFDFLYVTDANFDIAVIKFWGGLKAFGLDNVLKSGDFLLASNVQWRGKVASSDFSFLYATEFSVFSQHPKDESYKKAFNQFLNSFENVISFVNKAKEKISSVTKQRVHALQHNFGKPASTSTPYSHSSGANVCLDTPPTSFDVVQQRLRKLSKYGTPPPLPNLITNTSPLLKSEFRTPTFVPNAKQVEAQCKKKYEMENRDHF